jgi:hypothetical protein
MPIQLKISWEGHARGVEEHRLSIAMFGPALAELLRAYRRIASSMVKSANVGLVEHGRLHNLANHLDIEIESIAGTNPLELTAVCTFDAPVDIQTPFFPINLAERASKELLDSIEDESNGRARNSVIRSYLLKLPSQLTRQKYELHDNGHTLHEPIVIEHLKLATSGSPLPYLMEFEGHIVGVGFEPGANEVRVKTNEETIRMAASAELVEKALGLRDEPIKGMAVKRKEWRLLRIDEIDADPFIFSDDLREEHLFKRWDALLRKLAQ